MKIRRLESVLEQFALTRPYAIAGQEPVTHVGNVVVRIETDAGIVGLGAGSPGEHVTGETVESCRAALSPSNLEWLRGRDVRSLPALCREAEERFPLAPAARAAVDIALHDALAQRLGVPLSEMLGRVHEALPTSITIGIKPIAETLAEADEYLGRGFRVLKVKIGDSLEEDLERLAKLREARRNARRSPRRRQHRLHARGDRGLLRARRKPRHRVRRAARDARKLRRHPAPPAGMALPDCGRREPPRREGCAGTRRTRAAPAGSTTSS